MNKDIRLFLSYFIFLVLSIGTVHAQSTTEVAQDEKVYTVVEEMPRFPACESLEVDLSAKKKCADEQMLAYLYKQIVYPDSAVSQDIQGTVVINFTVEKDSTISSANIIRDIGGGCGEEALRVINALNDQNVRWVPGKKDGQPVRVALNIPIRFKLEEIPNYNLVDGDTIYTKFDTALEFKEGDQALQQFIIENLNYPEAGNDSCRIGIIELQAIVQPDDLVKVANMIDYSNLGIDYQFEAINVISETMGKWNQATLDGRKVPTAYPIRISFKPTVEACAEVVQQFESAELLADEGLKLYNEGSKEEGLEKLAKAIELFPRNADYRYARGMIYMNDNNMEAACTDLSIAKEIMMVTWFDNLIPVICAKPKEEEN